VLPLFVTSVPPTFHYCLHVSKQFNTDQGFVITWVFGTTPDE
jgi:hypothetical protein